MFGVGICKVLEPRGRGEGMIEGARTDL